MIREKYHNGLKRARRHAGFMSQLSLANAIGVTPLTVGKVEAGCYRNVKITNGRKWAGALNISLDEFYALIDEAIGARAKETCPSSGSTTARS